MQPSPLLASVRPDLAFDPAVHDAFDEVFLARVMEPTDACIEAMRRGVGMPDRAMRGWLAAADDAVSDDRLRRLSVVPAASGAAPGCLAADEAVAYRFAGTAWIDVDRRRRADIAARLNDDCGSEACIDRTDQVGRIGLVGPDAAKLLHALGLPRGAVEKAGRMTRIDVLEEPVAVVRSDFAGPEGYDLVAGREMFNATLAVICSWAVRLELNLLPCGLEAIERLAGRPISPPSTPPAPPASA